MNVPQTWTTVLMPQQEHVQTPMEVIFVPVTQDTLAMEKHALVRLKLYFSYYILFLKYKINQSNDQNHHASTLDPENSGLSHSI